jgi:hypothetical protein
MLPSGLDGQRIRRYHRCATIVASRAEAIAQQATAATDPTSHSRLHTQELVHMVGSNQPRRPIALYVLLLGLVLLGLGAVGGGYFLVLDPSGEIIGLPRTALDGSPFSDYLVPGLTLLLLLGLFPLLVAAALWRRSWWAHPAALLVSVLLLVFLAIEIAVVGYVADPPFQLVFGALGVVLLLLTLTPSVRAYCQKASLDLL